MIDFTRKYNLHGHEVCLRFLLLFWNPSNSQGIWFHLVWDPRFSGRTFVHFMYYWKQYLLRVYEKPLTIQGSGFLSLAPLYILIHIFWYILYILIHILMGTLCHPCHCAIHQSLISYRYKSLEDIFHVSVLFCDIGNDYNTSKLGVCN